jgi:hypothetical protein
MSDTNVFSHARYNELVNETIELMKELSRVKGGEYAGDQDRLANFRRNAERLGTYKELIWGVYAGKHWDAVMQYIQDIGAGVKRERMESLSGRCDDIIVYMLLFKAMIEENERPKDSYSDKQVVERNRLTLKDMAFPPAGIHIPKELI